MDTPRNIDYFRFIDVIRLKDIESEMRELEKSANYGGFKYQDTGNLPLKRLDRRPGGKSKNMRKITEKENSAATERNEK